MAFDLLDEIVRLAPLPAGARRLLDIGGGHGRYALAFLHKHPELRATVFDSPRALLAFLDRWHQAGLGQASSEQQ